MDPAAEEPLLELSNSSYTSSSTQLSTSPTKFANGFKVAEGQMLFYKFHRHRLRYGKSDMHTCEICYQYIHGGMLSCESCQLDYCERCIDKSELFVPRGSYDLFLSVVSGCWNTDVVSKDISLKFQIRTNIDVDLQSYHMGSKAWVNSPIIIQGEGIESKRERREYFIIGAITQPIKFRIRNLTLGQLRDLRIELMLSDYNESKTFDVLKTADFTDMYENLGKPDAFQRAVKYWDHVNLVPQVPLPEVPDEIRENRFSFKMPILCANKDFPGFVDLQCEIEGYQEVSDAIIDPSPIYINDIDIVKMLVRNRFDWERILHLLSSDILLEAFEICLARNWLNPFWLMIELLSVIDEELRNNNKPGNWVHIKEEAEEIVSKLLSGIPSQDEAYNALKYHLRCNELNVGAFKWIVSCELRVFSRSDSFFPLISQLWNEPTLLFGPFV